MPLLCLSQQFSERPVCAYDTATGEVLHALDPHHRIRGLVEERSSAPLAIYLSADGVRMLQKGTAGLPLREIKRIRHWRTFAGLNTQWGNRSHLTVESDIGTITEVRQLDTGRYRFRDSSPWAMHDFLGIVNNLVLSKEGPQGHESVWTMWKDGDVFE